MNHGENRQGEAFIVEVSVELAAKLESLDGLIPHDRRCCIGHRVVAHLERLVADADRKAGEVFDDADRPLSSLSVNELVNLLGCADPRTRREELVSVKAAVVQHQKLQAEATSSLSELVADLKQVRQAARFVFDSAAEFASWASETGAAIAKLASGPTKLLVMACWVDRTLGTYSPVDPPASMRKETN